MKDKEREDRVDGFLNTEMRFTGDLKKVDVEKNWERFLVNAAKQRIRKTRIILRYAAVAAAVIATGITLLLIQSEESSLLSVNTLEERTEVMLSDGTRIFLNRESEIYYPENLDPKLREVYLEGEAYFEVEHAQRSPFFVHAGDLTVRVVGTSFNVRETGNGSSEVHVSEGVVHIYTQGKESEAIELSAGELARYIHKDEELRLETFTTGNHLFWKTGILKYQDTPVYEIFEDLEQHFGKKIIPLDPAILENKFTSTHIDQELLEIVQEICLYFDQEYRVDGDTVFLKEIP
jgi:ferric-dicitrate binding protein FerR (iron transport regulator)